MAKRYIEANALIQDIEQSKANNNHNNSIACQTHNAEHKKFIKMVLDQPTADVVEVVRCEKCVWALEPIQEKIIGEEWETYHFCKIHNKYFTPDNYCSCGERRKE